MLRDDGPMIEALLYIQHAAVLVCGLNVKGSGGGE